MDFLRRVGVLCILLGLVQAQRIPGFSRRSSTSNDNNVATLRQKLLEKLLINNQLQQMAGLSGGNNQLQQMAGLTGGGNQFQQMAGLTGGNNQLQQMAGLTSGGMMGKSSQNNLLQMAGLMDGSMMGLSGNNMIKPQTKPLLGGSSMAGSLGLSTLLDSMSSPRTQSSSTNVNKQILSRNSAIQNLQNRLDIMRGNQIADASSLQGSMKGKIGFQTPTREQALPGTIVSQTKKETPTTSVKITVRKTTTKAAEKPKQVPKQPQFSAASLLASTAGKEMTGIPIPNSLTGLSAASNSLNGLTASNSLAVLSAGNSLTGLPATNAFSGVSATNSLAGNQNLLQAATAQVAPSVPQLQPPPPPPTPAISAPAPPKTQPSPSSQALNLLTANAAIKSAASMNSARQNQISDMVDTRMDMMSDMAEAGMMGGFGGLGMMGGMGGLGGLGGMGGLGGLGGMGMGMAGLLGGMDNSLMGGMGGGMGSMMGGLGGMMGGLGGMMGGLGGFGMFT